MRVRRRSESKVTVFYASRGPSPRGTRRNIPVTRPFTMRREPCGGIRMSHASLRRLARGPPDRCVGRRRPRRAGARRDVRARPRAGRAPRPAVRRVRDLLRGGVTLRRRAARRWTHAGLPHARRVALDPGRSPWRRGATRNAGARARVESDAGGRSHVDRARRTRGLRPASGVVGMRPGRGWQRRASRMARGRPRARAHTPPRARNARAPISPRDGAAKRRAPPRGRCAPRPRRARRRRR